MGKFLDETGLSEFWKQIKDKLGFSTDDTLTLKNDILSVSTPVKDVLTQEEFDVLPEEKRNHGLYIVKSDGHPLQGVEIEEYDTTVDGCDWHVVKYSNGRCEMYGRMKHENVPVSTAWGAGYVSDEFPRKMLPFQLVEKYLESGTISHANAALVFVTSGAFADPVDDYLDMAHMYMVYRGTIPSRFANFIVNFYVVGRWK